MEMRMIGAFGSTAPRRPQAETMAMARNARAARKRGRMRRPQVTGIAVSFPAFRSHVRRGSRLLLLAAAAFAFLSAEPAGFPPIPPLPASSWPSAEAAEPFARALLA